MGQAGQEPVLTADDYLAWEPAQFDRHEYLDGEVYRPHHLAHQCLDGSAIADVPRTAGRIGINYMDIDTIAAALKEGKSTVGRPVKGKKLQAPVFGMTVPVRDATDQPPIPCPSPGKTKSAN